MIDYQDFEILNTYICPLTEVSKDTSSDVSMINCDKKVINFDKVVKRYSKNNKFDSTVVCSADALSKTTNHHVLIEFKSGRIDPKELKYKIIGSEIMFCSITGCSIDYTKSCMDFILVYNREPNESLLNSYPRKQIIQYISGKAEEEFIEFGIGQYYKMCFNSAHTFTIDEFNHFLNELVSL